MAENKLMRQTEEGEEKSVAATGRSQASGVNISRFTFRFKFISIRCWNTTRMVFLFVHRVWKTRNVMISFANYNLLICVWKLETYFFYSLLLFYALVFISKCAPRTRSQHLVFLFISAYLHVECRLVCDSSGCCA